MTNDDSLLRLLVSILWPSFLVAIVATGITFSAFDPLAMIDLLSVPNLGRSGVYTLGFFGFWLLGAVSSTLTCYFLATPGSGRSGAQPHDLDL